jgi:hypothetical protein
MSFLSKKTLYFQNRPEKSQKITSGVTMQGSFGSMHSGAACGWENDTVHRVKEGQSRN